MGGLHLGFRYYSDPSNKGHSAESTPVEWTQILSTKYREETPL